MVKMMMVKMMMVMVIKVERVEEKVEMMMVMVIKVERVEAAATNFLFAYSAWIRWLAGLCNWICPAPRERDHVSSEPTGAGCHSTNRQTSLSQLKHLRITFEADCHGILP